MPGPDEECPVDLKYVDVYRDTTTSIIDIPEERHIDDFWVPVGKQLDGKAPDRELSEWWTEKTQFFFVMPQPRPGWEWVYGRETRLLDKSTRPDHCWPETWTTLSKKARRIEIEKGKVLRPLRQEARRLCRFEDHVKEEDKEDYNVQIEIARKEFAHKTPSPAMPVIDITTLQQEQSADTSHVLDHREKLDYNLDSYALVARPVPPS